MPGKCPIKAKAIAEGKIFYFTGKPCIRGHICERRVHKSVCLLCEKARTEKRWAKFENPVEARKNWKKEYYEKNPLAYEKLLAKNLQKYHSNEEYRIKCNKKKMDLYRKKMQFDPEYVKSEKIRSANWAKNNRPKRTAQAERRRSLEINATPKWLNAIEKAQIQEFYEISVAKEMQTGIKHEVDHIIPLKNKIVAGLNVPWNLQILTQKENRSKGNKYEIQ